MNSLRQLILAVIASDRRERGNPGRRGREQWSPHRHPGLPRPRQDFWRVLAMTSWTFSTLFLLTFNLPSFADSPGSSTANSLKVGAGARAVAMGEAATAVTEDVYSTYWNPAGLSRLSLKEAAFMHAQLVESIAYEYAALAVPTSLGTFAGSLAYFSYGDIEGFDNGGASLGTLQKSYDLFGSLSYGKLLTESLSLGFTGRYIYKRLVSDSASTLATDLGVQYKTALEGFTLAGVIQNLGGKLTFVQDANPLPMTFKLGGAYQRGRMLLALDLQKPRDQEAFVNAGLEVKPVTWGALRAGWKSKDEVSSGFRVGAGFTFLQNFTLDYAFMPFGAFGNTHRLSLSLRWGGRTDQAPEILDQKPLLGCVPGGDSLLNLLEEPGERGWLSANCHPTQPKT